MLTNDRALISPYILLHVHTYIYMYVHVHVYTCNYMCILVLFIYWITQLGSLTRIGTRKNWVVLKKDSHTARSRVEVYKDEDDVTKRHPTKVIGIDQISRINTSPEKKELTLILGDENIMFLCSSRADMDDWVRDIDGLRKHGSIKFGRRNSLENGMLPGRYILYYLSYVAMETKFYWHPSNACYYL